MPRGKRSRQPGVLSEAVGFVKDVAQEAKSATFNTAKTIAEMIESLQSKTRSGRRRRGKKQVRKEMAMGNVFPKVPGALTTSAPSAIGWMGFGNKFQLGSGSPKVKNVDCDVDGAIRVTGNSLMAGVTLQTDATPHVYCIDQSGSYLSWLNMNPKNIDPRLLKLDSLYEYYAIRSLRLLYVPGCGSNTNGILGLGLSQDVDLAVDITAPNLSQVLDLQHTIQTPVWQPSLLEYNYDGSKVWKTVSDESATGTLSDFVQFNLSAAQVGAPSSTLLGVPVVEYCIDYYGNSPAALNVE